MPDDPLPGPGDGPGSRDGYESHFGLAEPPFTLVSDTRFLFESGAYQAAYGEVAYALPRREPIVVITGAIGTGKTTLARTLAERRGPRMFVATIGAPPASADDLLRQILDGFGVLTDDTRQIVQAGHYALQKTLHRFLESLVALNAQAVVVFDEAQHLTPSLLEQIRLLLNTDDGAERPLQVVLMGQPELDDLLSRDDLRQFSQRITRRHRLGALGRDEVPGYIAHRLRVAQGNAVPGEPSAFTPAAIRAIATLSGGIPRVINTLGDRALEHAWKRQDRIADAGAVVQAAHDLRIDVPFGVRVRVKRRHLQVAALGLLSLAGLAIWVARDPARFGEEGPTAEPSVAEPIAAPSPLPVAAEPPPAAAAELAGEPAGDPVTLPATDLPAPDLTQGPADGSAPAAALSVPPTAASVSQAATGAAADALSAASPVPPSLFVVVVSSLRTRESADEVAAAVAALDLPTYIRNSSGWQQVVVGPYPSRREAAEAQQRLAAANMNGTEIQQRGR